MYAKYVELRDAKGVKDAEVARATQIPPSTFTDWKNGVSKPKADKLYKLAQYFETSIEMFLQKG